MEKLLLDAALPDIPAPAEMLPYIVVGLIAAAAITVSVILIVHFSRKKKN